MALCVQMAGLTLGPGTKPPPPQPQPMGTGYSRDGDGRGPPPGFPLGPTVQTYAPSPAYHTTGSYMSSLGPPTSALGPPTGASGGVHPQRQG